VGESLQTDPLSIIVATVPLKPVAPKQVSASKTHIEVAWDAQDDGGSDITTYTLFVNSGVDGAFVQIVSTLDLTYTLTDATTGQWYMFKLMSTNLVGVSQLSDPSEEMIAAVLPGQPGQPVYVYSAKTQIAFSWAAPAENGGTPLTGYKISWCQ
jgi:titin